MRHQILHRDSDNSTTSPELPKKSFTCKKCPKGFANKSSLIEHRRTHTGERQFTCNVCNKTLHSKYSLQRHQVKLHGSQSVQATDESSINDESQKLFTCSVCSQVCGGEEDLISHAQTHLVPKPAETKQTVGEKLVHSCQPCGLDFKLPHHLKQHQRTTRHLKKAESCQVTLR